MQHTYLIQTISPSESGPASYIEICQSVCSVIAQLANIDSVFSDFYVSSAGSSGCSYKLPSERSNQELKVIAEQMANDLLEYDRDKIARHDNEPNPTISFRRSIGLIQSLTFTKVKTNRLQIKFSLGGSLHGVFNIKYLAMNKEKHHSLGWYENVLKCVIDHFDPKYCALIFGNILSAAESKEMNLPHALGWMTYLKSDAGMVVPDTMQDVVIEQYGNGKFVLMSRDENYSESLSLADKRIKVLASMKELGRANKPS